jgi:uncharacterized small protein (DUF1192 family)
MNIEQRIVALEIEIRALCAVKVTPEERERLFDYHVPEKHAWETLFHDRVIELEREIDRLKALPDKWQAWNEACSR